MQNKMKQKTTTLLRTLCATLLLFGTTLSTRAEVIWSPTNQDLAIPSDDVVVISETIEVESGISVGEGGSLIILPGACLTTERTISVSEGGTVYVLGRLSAGESITNKGTIYIPTGVIGCGNIDAFREIVNTEGAIHCLKGRAHKIHSDDVVYGDIQDDLDVSTIYTFKKIDGVPADKAHGNEGYRDYYEAGLTFGDETVDLGQYFDLNLVSGSYEEIADLDDWKTRGEGVERYLEDYRAGKIDVLKAFAAELSVDEGTYGDYVDEIEESLHKNYIDQILTEGERAVALAYVTALYDEHPDDIDLEYFAALIAQASMDQLPDYIREANASTDLTRQKADAASDLDGKFSKLKKEFPDFCETYKDMVADVREACLARIDAAPSGYLLDEAVSLNEDDFDLLNGKASIVAELYELQTKIGDYDPESDVAAIVAATNWDDLFSIFWDVNKKYELVLQKLDSKTQLQELAVLYGYALSDEELQSIDDASDGDELQQAYDNLYMKIIGNMAFTIGSNFYPVVDAGNDQYAVLGGEVFFEDGLIYGNDRDVEVEYLTYARTFANTNWQPLYVPFSLSYDDWKDGYDVAAINNFHEYTDTDGEITSVELEVRFVTSGTLLPNHPYLIRAHEGSDEEQWFSLGARVLYSSAENSIDCSSVERTYTFAGSYKSMAGLKSMGAIFLSGGKLCMAADDDVTLKGQRWYLTVEDRNPQVIDDNASVRPVSYTIRVTGEGADDATAIGVITTPQPDATGAFVPAGLYNLQGQRVSDDYRGLVIENGRKVYRK